MKITKPFRLSLLTRPFRHDALRLGACLWRDNLCPKPYTRRHNSGTISAITLLLCSGCCCLGIPAKVSAIPADLQYRTPADKYNVNIKTGYDQLFVTEGAREVTIAAGDNLTITEGGRKVDITGDVEETINGEVSITSTGDYTVTAPNTGWFSRDGYKVTLFSGELGITV